MSRIGIKDLARMLVEKYEIERADAEQMASLFFDVLSEGLHADKQVKIKGFGTFKIAAVASRKSVDVTTGDAIIIEGRDKISFTADKTLADEVNRPFAQFETVVINEGVSFDEIDERYAAEEAAEAAAEAAAQEEVAALEAVAAEAVAAEESTAETTLAQEPAAAEETPTIEEAPTAEEAPAVDSPTPLTISNSQLIMLNNDTPSPQPEEKPQPEEAPLTEESTKQPAETTTQTETAASAVAKSEETIAQAEETDAQPEEASAAAEKVDANAGEADAQPEEQPAAEPEVSAEVIQEEELNGIKLDKMYTYVDELHERLDRQHKQMMLMMGIGIVALLACVVTIIYMGERLDKRENRIKHLKAQVRQMMPVEVQEGEDALSADSTYNLAQPTDNAAELAAAELAEQQKAEALAKATREAEQKEAEAAKEALKKQEAERAAKAKAAEEAQKKEAAQKLAAQKAEEARKLAEQKAAQAKKAEQQKNSIPDQSAYNKDSRIRHGAYNIVGIERTVKVRQGETLARISKNALGPGMECYIEAVNGWRKEFKAGETVKIPKLKVKKK